MTRWTARKKLKVVRDIQSGELSELAAKVKYSISSEEMDRWFKMASIYGRDGLKATRRMESTNV